MVETCKILTAFGKEAFRLWLRSKWEKTKSLTYFSFAWRALRDVTDDISLHELTVKSRTGDEIEGLAQEHWDSLGLSLIILEKTDGRNRRATSGGMAECADDNCFKPKEPAGFGVPRI